MINIDSSGRQIIPEEYVPTGKIDLCTNIIQNYTYLFNIDGYYPLLIGTGDVPRIWLFAKMSDGKYGAIVEDSVSKNNLIKVDIFLNKKIIEILDLFDKKLILRLSYKENLKITKMDLTPLGYNIIGDEEKLILAGLNYTGNHFKGTHTAFLFTSN